MKLDNVIHEPARLLLMTLLSGAESADFSFLLVASRLTKGNLSSHLIRLESAGYVEVTKSFRGRVPHTDYRLTTAGREALARYWGLLDAIRAQYVQEKLPQRDVPICLDTNWQPAKG